MAETLVLPSGREVKVRRDALERTLVAEAESLLASFPADHPVSTFLQDELRVATDAVRVGTRSALGGDPSAAFVFLRVIVEAAIRMSWLAADGPDEEKTRIRITRLEKLDLAQLLSASASIADVTRTEPLVTNAEELERIRQQIGHPAAPSSMREMAKEAEWEWLYGIHRLCSVALHPGIGARGRIAEAYEPEELRRLLRWSFSGAVCATAGVALGIFRSIDESLLSLNARVFANLGTEADSKSDE